MEQILKNKTEQEKTIPLTEFVYLNRRGFPCSTSWKYQLIRDGKFPYKTKVDKNTTYVIIDEKTN